MKFFLPFLLIAISFLKASGQELKNKERFAFVSIFLEDAYKIKVDSGQVVAAKKKPFMADSAGNDLRFVSSADALNYISNKGWRFQSVLQDIDETYSTSGRMHIQTTHYYLFKKEY